MRTAHQERISAGMKLLWARRRRQAATKQPRRPRRREPEQIFHQAVAEYLDRALPYSFFHTCFPSGGGGKVRGAKLKARGLRTGMPDHVVLAPQDARLEYDGATLWLELKSKTGSLSPEQKAMHERLRGLGHRVEVVRSLDQVEAVLADFCAPDKLRARVAA